jgi:hypothetical protein
LIQAFLVQPLRHIRKYVLATVFVALRKSFTSGSGDRLVAIALVRVEPCLTRKSAPARAG